MDSEHDEPVADLADEEGGDPVCWAHLVCLECGAVTTEGHRPGCQSAEAGAAAGAGDGQVRPEPWSG
jgi:hypothetical protein